MKTWLAVVVLCLASAAPALAAESEIHRLYLADQADRAGAKTIEDTLKIDWKAVGARDAARRDAARRLLDAGQLRSGGDLHDAAFIFQHGSDPDDFLLAHVLGMAAVAKGDPNGSWIAAAALDRYLQSIGRKQVFGTQTKQTGSAPPTKEPFDRALLPDPLRTALGVPTLAEQDKPAR